MLFILLVIDISMHLYFLFPCKFGCFILDRVNCKAVLFIELNLYPV